MIITSIKDAMTFSSDTASKVTLSDGPYSKASLWCLEPKQVIDLHSHAGDHHWMVCEGKGVLLTSNSEHPVAEGSVVFVPAGERHGMRAIDRLVFVSVSHG